MADIDAMPEGWMIPELGPEGHLPWKVLRRMRRHVLTEFLTSCDEPERAQRRALTRILTAASGSDFAEEHGLQGVSDLATFRRAVPVRTSVEYEPRLARVARGETHALLSHPVLSFVQTSGTTGDPKLLPVTAPWEAAVARGQAPWVLAMAKQLPSAAQFGARALTVVGRARQGRAAGRDVGANTGRMHHRQPWWIKARYAVPASVFDLPDSELRHYVLLRLALAVDVHTWTTANPSTILALCRALIRHRESLSADLRDGTLCHGPAAALDRVERRRLRPWVWRKRQLPVDWRPAAFWPNLVEIQCWKGGAAPFFISRLAAAVGRVLPVREVGISASEGHIAVPLHASWWGGVAHCGGHLLEFVPVDGGDALGPAELEGGRRYRVVLSTTAGLYRYDLNDVVQCEGWFRRAPLLRFVGKGSEVISSTGEKVTAEQVSLAAAEVLDDRVIGFCVGVELAEQPRLVLAIEGPVETGVQRAFDEAMQRLNEEYASKRRSDRLREPSVVALEQGTWSRWRSSRLAQGVADGQLKDPVIADQETLRRLIGGWRPEPTQRG
ncbi:MAG: hypothetical protein ACI9MC_002779 [Kiritimatiellia bacterium]